MPLLLSLTYHRKDGALVTFSGYPPETFARHAARHGVAALGVNCGKDVDLEISLVHPERGLRRCDVRLRTLKKTIGRLQSAAAV